MSRHNKATQPFRPSPHYIGAMLVLLLAGALFWWAGQLAASALTPLVALLVHAIERRDQRAQALARRIADRQDVEKIEVPSGAWGALARAVNGLLHERLLEQRLREALPAPLPIEAVHSLLGGDLLTQGQSRQVAVLLVGAPVRAPAWDQGVRRSGLVAWQALAHAAHDIAQGYGALLQPCGDAVMLVFGAFDDRTSSEALREALGAAEQLQRAWQATFVGAGPLALALASGYALAAALPGLGFCVVGAPVEQAVGLQQLALRARRSGLMCSEESYRSLRREQAAGWQPTDLRVSIANRPPQMVYRWGDAP